MGDDEQQWQSALDNFLCTGYYNLDDTNADATQQLSSAAGNVMHTQNHTTWTEDLSDYFSDGQPVGKRRAVYFPNHGEPLTIDGPGKILSVRGYPPLSLLRELGIKLRLAPQTLLGHLQLSHSFFSGSLYSRQPLSISISVVSLGFFTGIQGFHEPVALLQKSMNSRRQYNHEEAWRGCDTGVEQCRQITLLGSAWLAIEQQVTLIPYHFGDTTKWSAIIFNDSGHPKAPPPWTVTTSGLENALFYNVVEHSYHSLNGSSGGASSRTPDDKRPDPCFSKHRSGWRMPDRARTLCQKDPRAMAYDLLNTSALSWVQVISFLKLSPYNVDGDPQHYASRLGASKDFLDRANEYFSSVCVFLEARDHLQWPSAASNEDKQELDRAAILLWHDFSQLRNDAQAISEKCQQSISIVMSNITIADAKKSLAETRRVEILTYLAFIFIPISTVSSCFGMNLTIPDQPLSMFFTFALPITLVCLLVPVLVERWPMIKEGWQVAWTQARRRFRKNRI